MSISKSIKTGIDILPTGLTVKTISIQNIRHSVKSKKKRNLDVNRRGSRSSENAEFGHVTGVVFQRTAKKCSTSIAIALHVRPFV